MSNPRCDARPAAARALACRANTPSVAPRLALAAALLAGTAACTSAPQYPIYAGERPGDGSVMAVQPAYPISARDAQQNAADRASQNGYPAYGAPPVAGPQAPVYAPPPPSGAAPAQDDAVDDAPRGLQSAPVDSSDLPPPTADAPPPPPPPPQAETIAYGGGQLVFGADSIARPGLVFATEDGAPPPLDLVAYRHRRHPAKATADTATASDTTADAKPSAHSHRRHGAAKAEEAASDTAAADTPYQTVVKPGEKLSDVAERTHSSREALAALNDLKHPKHVKPGTVLKVPYRYTYEVQKGDTLYTISHRFNQDPAAMAKLNSLKAVPTLQPGETIQLPPTAEDTGKRDHASAAGPSPVAAPEKLADAAARKELRHGRKRHAEEAAAPPAEVASAVPASEPPAKLSRAERRRLLREQKAAAVATAAPDAAAPTGASAAEPEPAHLSRAERRRLRREEKASRLAAATPSYTPPAPVSSPPARPPTVAQAAPPTSTAPAPQPYASQPYTPTTSPPAATPYPSTSTAIVTPRTSPTPAVSSSSLAAAGATTTQPYYAGTRPYKASTPAPAASTPYRAAAGSSVAASTYAMPGYAARTPSTAAATTAGASRVASLTPPTYSPSYAAGGASTAGYAPSLGRARPVTPTVSGIAGMTPTQITAAGRGRFIWPLRGQVISPFGDKGTGQHNDGVDIAATPGSGVRAAAAGEVVYAGSSIPGFGNLVLVKHSGGWVTAYAHLDRIEVRMRDSVAQGDELGQAGQTGAVDRPQLHFEVRYAPDPTEKARPVDPTLVLPAG